MTTPASNPPSRVRDGLCGCGTIRRARLQGFESSQRVISARYLAHLSLCWALRLPPRRRIGRGDPPHENQRPLRFRSVAICAYALRGLARRPAFTFAAVLTLALGIGATTAIFSVVYSVLIKPLPYPNADELVRIRHQRTRRSMASGLRSATMYFTYRDENRTLASIGLWQEALGDADRPRRAGAGARSSSHGRHAAGARRAADARTVVHRTGVRTRGRGAGAGHSLLWVLATAIRRRRSGARASSSRWRRRAAAGEARAGQWQVVGIMPRDFRFLDMAPQPDVIVAVRLDPARSR